MSKTREQRHKKKAWVEAIICGMIVVAMLAATTVACARADRLSEEADKELSEEHQMYLEAQEPAVPQTWDELAATLEDEVPEDAEAPYESERIEEALLAKATKIENATVSHYCICKRCCGKDENHPAYGITASGRRAEPGVSVAVDPKVIPLGSEVMVDYGDGIIHYYRADDTGSAVKGAKLDLCMGDHDTAWDMGVRTATVWWVEGE